MPDSTAERTAVIASTIISFLLVAGAVIFFLCTSVLGPMMFADRWTQSHAAGMEALKQGSIQQAESNFLDAVECARRIQGNEKMADSLYELGKVYMQEGKVELARDSLARALAGYKLAIETEPSNAQLGTTSSIKRIEILLCLAEMDEKEKKFDDAMAKITDAVNVRKTHVLPLGKMDAIYKLKAKLLHDLGRDEEAEQIEDGWTRFSR